MPTDYFMKIDSIPGDSLDSKHPNEIEVVSWSWGETKVITFGGSGSTAGKADIQDLHFTARTSKASPLLFVTCATGTHLKSAELVARKPGATPIEYLKVTLSDVLISSYQVAGNENDDVPLDQVSLNFNKIQISYTTQSPSGAAGTTVTKGWNKVTNTPF